MYTKQEESAIRQEFWTTMGKYLSPIPSSTGNKVNWINYKTGIKNIQFKMDADKREAVVRIEIRGDAEKRAITFDLFLSLKKAFQAYVTNDYVWLPETEDEFGKTISCIYCISNDVNIFNKNDWPAMIVFFKTNITSLDSFWAEYKEVFEMSI